MRACCRFCLDEQVNVVWHYFHNLYDDVYFSRLFFEKVFQSVCDMTLQNLAPILRTPNDMITDIIDGGV